MGSKNTIIIMLLGIFVLILIVLASGCQKSPQVCFQSNCFDVELATTPEARAQGLMFRESIDETKGMLFIFPEEGFYSFWMKNTKIALDIIWLDSDGKVVFISRDTQPCQEGQEEPCPTIMPDELAKYVLELKAGMAESIELDIDDVLTINVPQEIIESAK